MACVTVPIVEAVITTITAKVVEEKEAKAIKNIGEENLPEQEKMGGSGLLVFEHIWHCEIVPWFPFLTAASDAADTAAMLHEMATAGVGMSLLVTAVWLAMVGISSAVEKKALKEQTSEN